MESTMTVEVSTASDDGVNVASSKPSSADMAFYYERLLPFRYVFQWLNHSPKPTKDFTMREFAYEHRSGAYQRYNSFATLDEFKKSVVSANPMRFEIGPVYSVNPKERKNLSKNAMRPLAKELVFDIDLTDYDGIRTCCSGTKICEKCWKFIQVAAKIIDRSLKEDFGFKHLIWVFSGRRGAHCWISDARARNLDELTRRSIVEYLDVLGSKQAKMGKQSLNLKRPFHPHIERSFEILKTSFVEIVLNDQDPWNDDNEQIDEMLAFLPDKDLQQELQKKWKNSSSNSKQKWEDIGIVAEKIIKNQARLNAVNEAKKDIIFYYLYPRLDVEVSRQLIHLLKSPFCIHPSTGNICVPFDLDYNLSDNRDDDGYGFNPMHAPNLITIQNELELYDSRNVDRASSQPSTDDENEAPTTKVLDFEKTSLKPYVNYFAKFVNDLVKDELKSQKRDRDDLEF
ncbi:DNA primase small subunit [[Candida] jaroonii]|uniref:DNA primase small subunit n=1 Tax=[Candida] jaroonii TaxID=467808 RepID=A0ACA9XZW1_9ASCO|nr:DNA primase small subunit [[Candida] jaroonii]